MQRILFIVVLSVFAALPLAAQRVCATHDYLQQELLANPSLSKKISDIELFTTRIKNELPALKTEGVGTALTVIKIPVVFHILYNTPVQNISDAQIQSQLEALNRDYRMLNSDTANIPAAFKDRAADCHIEFYLAKVDPKGRATTGIIRKPTSIQFFGLDDRIKNSAIGGDDPWNADSYLNIWVGNMAGGLLGYANPLGGPKEKDGVVLMHSAVGTTGTISAPYNKGRTATHEVGHWLGLRHIWGDSYCGNDNIDDTPQQRSPSYGCPKGVITTCDNGPAGNMYMNYMDLSNDACINMFTYGQREKMRAMFAEGGPRNALLNSNGLGTPLPQPVESPVDTVATSTSVRIHPNPAYNFIMLDLGNQQDLIGKVLTIYSAQGQVAMQTRITSLIMTVYVSQLRTGVYVLRIEGQKKAWKVIKQ